jgi:dTDP-4-amino-4,6-dideoxygalactose transaminase
LAQTPNLSQALIDTFSRVMHSGQYILGAEVAAFEAEAAAYCGAAHAVGTSSGTDALLLALMAHDIGPGDDVLCPTYTFFATAGTIARTGARPVFVDICPGCYNMHPDACSQALTPNTRAIIAVHLFGQTAHMTLLRAFAKSQKLVVIEDAAQAIGAHSGSERAGSMGDAGCFSFFPSKNLGALGDAGMVTTQHATLAERMRILRVHGGAPKYYHSSIGGNFRIDALQAALLRVKLPYLDAASEQRAKHAALYQSMFEASGLAAAQACVCAGQLPAQSDFNEPPLGLPNVPQGRHIYNQYTLRVRRGRRDSLRAALHKLGIGTEIYYPVPMHLQPCFAALGYQQGDLPHAEAAAEQSLALPIFPELHPKEICRVAEAVIAQC